MNIIFNFTMHEHYKLFRLNRTFARLINKRRKGLTFRLGEVSPTIFFGLLKQTTTSLKTLKIAANLKFIKKTQFDDN